MIFPPLLSIKNSILTTNMSPVASSDRLLHLCEPHELSSALTARGGGGDPLLWSILCCKQFNKIGRIRKLSFPSDGATCYFISAEVGDHLPYWLLTSFIEIQKCASMQPGESTQSRLTVLPGLAGSCRKSPQKHTSVVAGHFGQEPDWGSLPKSFLREALAAVKPLLGHCHPTVSQNTDLLGSHKQHSAFLPNPLSMHIRKVLVRIELYFIPGGPLAGLSLEEWHPWAWC